MAIASLLAISGCASVEVRKVPTPTQYIQWSDKDQRAADAIPGVRYYMPRPFLNVFESFPVRTDIYLAEGLISPDGRYVLVKRVRALDGQWTAPAELVQGEVRIPRAVIGEADKDLVKALVTPGADRGEIKPQSTPDAASGGATPPKVPTPGSVEELKKLIADRDAKIKKLEEVAAASDSQKTGQLEQRVRNDNSAMAYQPMRGNFDIAYLPDFEEQYAVVARSGLGNAKVLMNMGQGWSLQGLDAMSDNSELNKRIFDIIDTAIKLGKSAASMSLGLPPGASSIIVPQTATVFSESSPATPVTLRFVVVHYAAKGVYPVIKPRELQARIVTNDPASLYTVNLHESEARPQAAAGLMPVRAAAGQSTVDESRLSFTVPRYPYQFISFNTFKYIMIEAITPANGFGSLYDKTGTTGDPGDRQRADLTDVIRRFAHGTPADAASLIFAKLREDREAVEKKIREDVNAIVKANSDLEGHELEALTITPTPSERKIVLSLKFVSNPAQPNIVRLLSEVSGQMSAWIKSQNLDPKSVEIKPEIAAR